MTTRALLIVHANRIGVALAALPVVAFAIVLLSALRQCYRNACATVERSAAWRVEIDIPANDLGTIV